MLMASPDDNCKCLFFIIVLILIHSLLLITGEKLNSTDVDTLVQGLEDSNGMINYEGTIKISNFLMYSQMLR